MGNLPTVLLTGTVVLYAPYIGDKLRQVIELLREFVANTRRIPIKDKQW